MKKIFILIIGAAILLSGCVDKTVKTGDNISVNYTGSFVNGKVFDTSIEKVAEENNLPPRFGGYQPLNFTVGKEQMIKGFDEGVIGMKVGETRVLTIPPEKAYGPSNPDMIRSIPIEFTVPATKEMPATTEIFKVIDIPVSDFEGIVGPGHKVGEIVTIPETNINVTIQNITSSVSLIYNLKVGDEVWSQGSPWNETVVKIDDKNITLRAKVSKNQNVQLPRSPWNESVVKIDDKNITLRANLSKNQIIQFPEAPFNTTVLDITETNITLRHNPIPDKTISIPGMYGQMEEIRISFNETSMIMDSNREVAGKTLIFNVTLVSIDK